MTDDLSILIAASLDEKKSASNIEAQIVKIEKQLSNINISLDLNSAQTSFKNMMREVSKDASKIKIYDSNSTKSEINKTINDFSKLKMEIEKKLNSLPSKNIGTSTTNDMFAMVNTADSYKDLKAVKQLADEYYADCIKNEKEYQAQKKIINDGTKDAFKQESSNIDYIYSKKKQLLDLERQIDNAVINKGVNKDDFDISSIKSELDKLSSSKTEILNDEKNKINEIINNLKLQIKSEKDIVDVKIKQENAYINIEKQLNKINSITNNSSKYNSNTYSKLVGDLEKLKYAVENGDISFAEFTNEIKKSEVAVSSFDQETRKLSSSTDTLGDSFKRAFAMFTMYDALQIGKRAIGGMVSEVKELDSSMISLRRVTSETDSTYQSFLSNISDTAMSIGAQIPDIIDSVTSFSKLGYSFAESQKLAIDATKYATAGEMQLATATDALSASYAVFKNEVKDTTEIIDLYNHIGNTMAITSEGIGNAMKLSANSLSIANNSISESVSMIAAANRTVLDPEKIGAGLRVISMRLRGVSEESGELIPKMREDILSLTNGMVDIWDEANNEFKSTYDNLLSIGKVYDTLDDKKAANLLEKIAGKNRAEIAAAIITNTEDMKKGLEEAGKAAGSVNMEVEASMNSIEKKTEQVGIAFSKLASETINGDFVKSVLDTTVSITEMVTEMGGLTPIVSGLGIAFAALKFNSMVGGIKSVSDVTAGMSLIMNGATVSATALSLAMNLFVGGAIIAGVVGVTKVLDVMVTTVEEQSIKVGELKDKYNELNGEIEVLRGLSNPTEADNTILKYKELELEATRLLVEENEKLLVQKEMFGKGVWGDGDMSGIEQTISDAKQLQDAIENVKLDIANMKSINVNGEYDSSIEMQEEHLVNLYSQQVGIVPSLTQAYDKLTGSRKYADDKQKEQIDTNLQAIDEIISESDAITNLGTASKQTSEDVNTLSDNVNSMSNPKIDPSSFTDLTSQFEAAMKIVDPLDSAMKELNSTGTLSEDVIKSLAKEYPELLSAMSSREELEKAINDEMLNNQIDKTIKDTELLRKSIQALNEGQVLQADTISNLIEKYPSMANEIKLVDGQYKVNKDSLQDLLDMEVSEAQTAIDNQVTKTTETLNQTKARIAQHNSEIESIKTVAQAYQMLAGLMAKAQAEAQSYIGDYKGYVYGSGGVSDETKQKLKDAAEVSGAIEKFEKEMAEIEVRRQKLLAGTSTANTKASGGLGKSKKDKDTKKDIKDTFDAAISEIQSSRDRLDAQISKGNKQIELFTLKGDTSSVQKLESEMTILLDKRKQLTEAENVSYRQLQGSLQAKLKSVKTEEELITVKEQILKLDELMSSNSETWWDDRKSQLENEISLIEKKHELEQRAYDDKIKKLELQQILMDEDSNEYQAIEQQKLNMLVELQSSYQDKIRELKAKGLSNEQEDVRKYIDLYVDAEEERLNMIKSMAEQRRKAELESVNTKVDHLKAQQDAQKKIHDEILKMIKQEADAKKKAIQDEISGYEKIINAKKQSLRDEQDKSNYEEELSEKQKVVTDLENKLMALGNDNSESAKAARLKLQEELAKATTDLNKFQLNQSIKDQETALDKELENFKDEKQNELDEMDDFLSKEGKMREEAIKLLESRNKSLYDKLKKWNSEYGSMASSELDELWSTATTSIDGYTNSNQSLLEIMKEITAELKEQQRLQKQVNNSGWQDYTPNGDSNIGGGNNSSTQNKSTIEKMKSNSEKWKNTNNQDERDRLSNENKKLGDSIGAYRDPSTGKWYVSKDKKIPLFHKGLEFGRTGDGLKPNEMVAKLTKDEWIFTDKQFSNLTKNLNGIMKNDNQIPNIALHIDKLIDVDKIDNNTDIEGITGRAIKEVMKQIKENLGNIGLRPKLR